MAVRHIHRVLAAPLVLGAGRPPSVCTARHALLRLSTASRRGAYSGSAAQALAKGTAGGAKKLSDIAKVPLLLKESPVRVREIWLEKYRGTDEVVSGTMASDEYHVVRANAAACPMFLVPVPRGEGYMNLVWQYKNDSFLYQTLESLQQGGAGSVDLGMVFFGELLASHKMVLLQGTLQSGLLTKTEAERIIRYTREAYMDPARFAWVQRFNQRPREFNYEDFLKEFRPLEKWHTMQSD